MIVGNASTICLCFVPCSDNVSGFGEVDRPRGHLKTQEERISERSTERFDSGVRRWMNTVKRLRRRLIAVSI